MYHNQFKEKEKASTLDVNILDTFQIPSKNALKLDKNCFF